MTKASRTALYALIEAGQQAHRVLLRPLLERGLEPGDDAILMLIEDGGTSETALAEESRTSLDLLHARVERLVTREILVRTARGLALTERGGRLRDHLQKLWAEMELALTGSLKRKQRKELAELLLSFADHLARRGPQ